MEKSDQGSAGADRGSQRGGLGPRKTAGGQTGGDPARGRRREGKGSLGSGRVLKRGGAGKAAETRVVNRGTGRLTKKTDKKDGPHGENPGPSPKSGRR